MVTPRKEPTFLYADSDARPVLDLRRPAWMADAACRQSGLDFTDDKNKTTRDACLQLCGVCPVRVPCFDWAVGIPEQLGVAGGTTTAARRAIRNNRKNQSKKEITDAST